jgi:hypothetical protein
MLCARRAWRDATGNAPRLGSRYFIVPIAAANARLAHGHACYEPGSDVAPDPTPQSFSV